MPESRLSRPLRAVAWSAAFWSTAALVGLGVAAPVHAQTLRWAAQGDSLTMDPHAQNEGSTNNLNGQVYETLVERDRQLNLVPSLATSWEQVNPTLWRFKLRPGVKFHDGGAFSADDVVFSVLRAQSSTSNFITYAKALGTPVKVDAQTVEFRLPRVNPIFLQHLATIRVMSKAWCEQHRVTRPLDLKAKEESHANFNANGTGPYKLTSRQPGVKTVLSRNTAWWGRFEGNVQQVVYTPIANDATRLAALVSGELDLVQDPAPRDIARLRNTPSVKVIEGPENRVLFIGMDQSRDQLLYGSVKDRNPFKDLRVRTALYQAIDIETLRSRLMNGLARPTGNLMASPLGTYQDPSFETRLPYDLAKAKALMAEAGYGEGFEVTLDCPNNRYINDEEICIALAGMWAQLKVKVKVNAQPRALWFPRMEKFDTSFYLLGWGGSVTDAETTLTPVMRAPAEGGLGIYNWGRVKNEKFEALAAASSVESDPKKREGLVKAAVREYIDQRHLLPLHRQVIPWAMRPNVDVVHRPDNWVEVAWATVR